jgi:hypothetical protein
MCRDEFFTSIDIAQIQPGRLQDGSGMVYRSVFVQLEPVHGPGLYGAAERADVSAEL